MRPLLILLLLLPVLASPASGQSASDPGHVETLARLGASCLAEIVSQQDQFRLQTQGTLSGTSGTDMLSSPWAAAWTSEGKTVFMQPSDAVAPLLVITVDRAELMLKRSGRKHVERHDSMNLTWWLSDTDGQLLGTDSCQQAGTDRLTRSAARAMADPRSPVTNPDLPPRSRIWNAAEPAVLIGATAVGTYLLFNLRSRRADNG